LNNGKLFLSMTKVELIRGENRRKAVKAAVDALGHDFTSRVRDIEYILIKVDLAHPQEQLASVHTDAVRGVLDILKMYSDVPIVIADAAQYGTKAAFRNFEYEALAREYKNVSLCDLHDDTFIEQTIQRADGTSLVIRRSRIAVEAPFSLSISNMKTHYAYGAGLSVSSFAEGTWLVPARMTEGQKVWSREPWLMSFGEEEAHTVVSELFAMTPCHMGIIDGILAMEGRGPIEGTPVHMGVVLAGMDPVAVDTVAATLMGFDPHDIRYLEALAQKGMGTNEISDIEVPLFDLQELSKSFIRA
jgi:uncharacterized protein (DUF362 family)